MSSESKPTFKAYKTDVSREVYACIFEFPPRDFTVAQTGAISTVRMCFLRWSDQRKRDLATGT